MNKYCKEQIPSVLFFNRLQCALDPEYEKQVLLNGFKALFFNKRHKQLLDELRQLYGLKLDEFATIAFEQAGIDFN